MTALKSELLKRGMIQLDTDTALNNQVAKISMKEQNVDFERRSQSDCVHEQVAKADCECPLYRIKEEA